MQKKTGSHWRPPVRKELDSINQVSWAQRARCRSSGEDVSNQVHHVGNVDCAVAVDITYGERYGGRATAIDISLNVYRVRYIYGVTAVSVTARSAGTALSRTAKPDPTSVIKRLVRRRVIHFEIAVGCVAEHRV